MSSANQNKPFSWNLPELSIRGAGQEDRSSGYENESKHDEHDVEIHVTSQFAIIQSHYTCKVCSNFPGIRLEQPLQRSADKIEHLSSHADVVHTTPKQVFSRRTKNENDSKMSKNERDENI